MIILMNTDKTLSGDSETQEYFTSQVKESLKKYQSHISRIEIHLKDENGIKDGVDDVSCLIEARLNGRKPIAITSQADTKEHAFSAAVRKIEGAIGSVLGRIQNNY